MKTIASCLVLSYLIFCFTSCKKADQKLDYKISMISEARSYFEKEVDKTISNHLSQGNNQLQSTPRNRISKTAVWDEAYTVPFFNGDAVVVPIHFNRPFLMESNLAPKRLYNVEDLTQLIVYKDKIGAFHAESVMIFPDSSYLSKTQQKFSGLMIVEDWFGMPLIKFRYSPDRSVVVSTEALLEKAARGTVNNQSPKNDSRVITICYEITGYNYSVDNPSEGYSWSEPAGCTSTYFPEVEYTSIPKAQDYMQLEGGGGRNSYPVNAFAFLPGRDKITNYKSYMKCFDIQNNPNYSYQVTICVAQPNPGTRATWTFNPLSGASSSANDVVGVGHTFLMLRETSPNGSVVRNVGFYPSVSVDPSSPSSLGNLNNDELHDYDVSLTMDLTSTQFSNLIDFFGRAFPDNWIYDLNTFNCTTFAVNALSSIGFYLPRTTGTWPHGGGLNPGDLGEDIREMNLASNVTRALVGVHHQNEGTCN